jgi:hypothetical protein
MPEMDDQTPVHENEALFLAQIARAKRYVYIESQYFASRRVAEAIARRLDEENGPEFVIVNPLTAQGWLEPIAMDTARARLVEALRRRDRHGRFRIYHPFTAGGEPIYCHAKILIADDRVFRLGFVQSQQPFDAAGHRMRPGDRGRGGQRRGGGSGDPRRPARRASGHQPRRGAGGGATDRR